MREIKEEIIKENIKENIYEDIREYKRGWDNIVHLRPWDQHGITNY